MTWRTIRDDTAEHGMYVVEMAFVVILMSFFNAQDDMAHHTGWIRQNTECMWWRWHL